MKTNALLSGDVTDSHVICQICGYETYEPNPRDLGTVRGNTARFVDTTYTLWRCPECSTIYSLDKVDLADIYRAYPLEKRRLDIFARGTMRSLLKRLRKAGLRRNWRILDYGCGNGVFLQYLREKGYRCLSGYDPFVEAYSALPSDSTAFDLVLLNDTIEHCDDIRGTILECASYLRSGGILYIGTADSGGVEMHELKPHIMRFHQPFHRIVMSESTLQGLGPEVGLELVASYRRSYMDTLFPFVNYRFLDEFSTALGHNWDEAFKPEAAAVVLKHPRVLFFGLFGYFFPSAYEPAVVLRKP